MPMEHAVPTLKEIIQLECPDLAPGVLRARELRTRVTEIFMSTGAPCSSQSAIFRNWPGRSGNVFRWFVLDDGMAIGLQGAAGAVSGIARHPYNKIRYMDWNRLRTCRVVHRAGSFTKAGQMLDLTQSAVSRQVAAVEAELGGDIFLRNNDGLIPTELGISFLETIDRMWQALELGLAQLNELKDDPQGPLTLTTTAGFGSAWLSSRMKRFHDRYPNIEVTLLLIDNAELDLRQREADCAIRFQHPTEPRLVRRFIDDYSYHIFGSRDYIERRGMPTSLEDLENHQLIVYGDGVGQPPIEKINWLLTEGMPAGITRKAGLRVNSVYGIYRAVEAGLGLAALPFYMSERSAKLIEVLPDIAGPSIPVYFVYPEELGPSRRIAALRDFIIEEIRATWGDLKRQKLA